MPKKWIIKDPDINVVEALEKDLGFDKLLCQLLVHRHILTEKEAKRFLHGSLDNLYDPMLLKDMEKAVGRIHRAIERKESILIFSDYDVDGITACAIVEKTLKKLGAHVFHYIPHRIKEGYGLNASVLTHLRKHNATLLITLDCGIQSFDEVESLNHHHIDTIIVDHHKIEKDAIPKAYAVINPRRSDCAYPFDDLAAVGLAFKLSCALTKSQGKEYLDLVTLGTIADVVPLIDENRIIVKNGLEYIKQSTNVGVRALIEASGLKDKEINAGKVSFILAPRINASGRIDTAEKSLELLLVDSFEEAQAIAKHLNQCNSFRQRLEGDVLKEAIGIVERTINFKEHSIIVLAQKDWHVGVLGIVASKIAEKYFRPTIVISLQDGVGRGSGRSIPGFHLFDALLECRDHLVTFGGHSHAIGLTVEEKKVKEFAHAINQKVREKMIMDDLKPILEIDAQVPLACLHKELVESVSQLSPFGIGNPRPLFCSHGLTIKSPAALLGRDTIKFWLTDHDCTYEAIGFGLKDYAPYIIPSKHVDIAYHISLDTWQTVNAVLLEIKDMHFIDSIDPLDVFLG